MQITGEIQNLVNSKQARSIVMKMQRCDSIFFHFNKEVGEKEIQCNF